MKQQTIDELLVLAFEAYTTNESSDQYACNAASQAAADAAKKHSEECADAAAALGAMSQLKASGQATLYSVGVADTANLKFAYERSLIAARHTFSHRKTPIRKAIDTSYAELVHEIEAKINVTDEQINSNYQSAFSKDATVTQKSKRAACYVYSHTYAAARTAYVLASFQANKTQDAYKREQTFKSCMSERLNHDLTYDQIQPSLLLQMMCSNILVVIAGVLIIAGVAAILCATYGIASIPFVIMITAGSVSAASGTGLLIGSFFAKRNQQKIIDTNERAEETNAIF